MMLGALAGMAVSLIFRRQDIFKARRTLTLVILLLFAANVTIAEVSTGNRVCIAGAALLMGIAVFFKIPRFNGGLELVRFPGVVFCIVIFIAWMVAGTGMGSFPLFVRLPAAIVLESLLVVGAVVAIRLVKLESQRYSWAHVVGYCCKFATIILLVAVPTIMFSRAEGQRQPAWPPSVADGSRPNVILITLDTVSAGHMGIYGYPRANTPHLGEFLKHATLYTRFIAVSPLTLTSHASIFTGLYPQSHGAYMDFTRFKNGRPLVGSIPTMAQILTGAGYRTMAVAANKNYLSDDFGTLRGFQYVEWLGPITLIASERDYLLRNRFRGLLRFPTVARDLDSSAMPAEAVNQRAFELLDQMRDQRAPFFLFLNYMDAHVPYLPPVPYNSMYPGLNPGYGLVRYFAEIGDVMVRHRPINARFREHLVSQYDGAIAYLDAAMGDLIAHLKQNGQFEKTLIIITSDHGEAFGDRNLLGHNSSVYQDQIRVPLLVKYPEQTQPERIQDLTTHVDLLPTVLDVAGLKSPGGMQGVDLRRLAAAEGRVVVAEMHGSAGSDLPSLLQIEWALYSGSRKMIYSSKGMRELYDLSVDPDEHHNLYAADAPLTAELRQQLIAWSRQTPPRFLDPSPSARVVEERLKSLGYAHQGVD
jgi:arylsulfatase A-like enzyme